MPIVQSRRRFLTNAAFAGAAGLGGFGPWGKVFAVEPPPEITTIRFEKDSGTCIAPLAFQELRVAARRGLYRYPLRRADVSACTPGRCCQIRRYFQYDRTR